MRHCVVYILRKDAMRNMWLLIGRRDDLLMRLGRHIDVVYILHRHGHMNLMLCQLRKRKSGSPRRMSSLFSRATRRVSSLARRSPDCSRKTATLGVRRRTKAPARSSNGVSRTLVFGATTSPCRTEKRSATLGGTSLCMNSSTRSSPVATLRTIRHCPFTNLLIKCRKSSISTTSRQRSLFRWAG